MPRSEKREPRSGTQAVERAIAILRCFERSPELGVSDLVLATGLSTATTHRIVRALRADGLLDQSPRSERYRLGLTIAVLGRLALEHLGFSRALPALEALAAHTLEAVNLGVRVGDEVLVLVAIPCQHPLRFDQVPGTRNPVHACAMGKALLAFGPETPVGQETLERFTARTLTTRAEVEAQYDAVRARGYSLNDEERNVGVRALSAPIRDERGRVIAAIALQGPTVRLTDEQIPVLAGELLDAARAIGRDVATQERTPRPRPPSPAREPTRP